MMLDLGPLRLSLQVASTATLGNLLVGAPLALLFARRRFPGREWASGALMLPLVLPPTVLGFVLLELLGRRGPIGMALEHAFGAVIVFHWTGAAVASAVASFPLLFLPARAAFESVPPDLENAARLLGRSEWSVFRHVTLPLAWGGLATGLVLAFARALGDFGATLMVAGDIPGRTRTASLAIYDAVRDGETSRAWVLSFLIATVSLIALRFVRRGLGPK